MIATATAMSLEIFTSKKIDDDVIVLGARLILASRGIEPTLEAMAGAVLERLEANEQRQMLKGLIEGLGGGKKA